MRPPEFWQRGGWQAAALTPFEIITARMTARRVARPGWQAPVPVICCGNASVGGTGKTPLALDILSRLQARGVAAHALLRGHGGGSRGVTRVDPLRHDAAAVGDEALLLAEAAPWGVGADRGEAARRAVASGAAALVMDDGLQNPTLRKDASILLIDGAAGFGNGRLLPAGPLREPVLSAASRCRLAVLIGDDRHGARAALPQALPVLRANLTPGPDMQAMAGNRVMAFAGIGRPNKFFDTLSEAGVAVVAAVPFPDHHPYTMRQVNALRRRAEAAGAALVTTAKDYARLPAGWRAGIIPLRVVLTWEDEAAFDAQLLEFVP
jgi:tetraacyldisaccharide 4'-kinase